jgi:hypothetical protein
MQAEMQDDLGLDLLINPKLKHSDASSVRSSVISKEDDFVIDVAENSEDNISIVSDSVYSVKRDSNTQPRNSGQFFAKKAASSIADDSDEISLDSMIREHKSNKLSNEEVFMMKKELLYQFERLEKKGAKLPKKFTLSSDLEEMKIELERIKKDKSIDNSIKMQRRIMMAAISGVEWLNGKFDPLGVKLDGWSDSIYDNIDDYDDIFEQLHEKYKGKGTMAPELKLIMMLGGSAFMHHMTHSMFKSQLPGLDEILKQNPELAQNLAAATTQHMSKASQAQNSLFGSLGNMFMGGVFGGGDRSSGPIGPKSSASQQGGLFNQSVNVETKSSPQRTMNGPSNVEDLLKEIENSARFQNNENDRIEMMSIITESELAESNILDDASSIQGIVVKNNGRQRKKKPTKTMDIDI